MFEHAAFSTEEGKKFRKSYLRAEMMVIIVCILGLATSAFHFLGSDDLSGFIRDGLFYLVALTTMETAMGIKAKNFVHEYRISRDNVG